jgi:hypothetical protein
MAAAVAFLRCLDFGREVLSFDVAAGVSGSVIADGEGETRVDVEIAAWL